MGAIASGGARVLNEQVLAWERIAPSAIEATARDTPISRRRATTKYGRCCMRPQPRAQAGRYLRSRASARNEATPNAEVKTSAAVPARERSTSNTNGAAA